MPSLTAENGLARFVCYTAGKSNHPSATKVICEAWPPLTQIMDSPTSFATSFAMPTAYESNHSGAGTLHPHRSATFFLYVTLRGPIPPQKISCPFLLGIPTLSEKIILHPTDPPPEQHNWRTYTELLLLLVMYDKLA